MLYQKAKALPRFFAAFTILLLFLSGLNACEQVNKDDKNAPLYGFAQQPFMMKSGDGTLLFPLGLNSFINDGGFTVIKIHPKSLKTEKIVFQWKDARRVIDITSSSDGGFLLAGSRVDTVETMPLKTCWLMKADEKGKTEWEKEYSLTDLNCFTTVLDADSMYYLTAALTDDSLNRQASLLKIDTNGELVWEAGLEQFFAYPTHLALDIQGNVIAGESDILTPSEASEQQRSFILQKTSPSGKYLFSQQYINSIKLRSIEGASDSGFTISGIFEIQGNMGVMAYGILHFSQNGEFAWQYAVPAIDNVNPFRDLTEPVRFSLSFLSKTKNPNLVMLDEEGNVQFMKSFLADDVKNYPLVEKIDDDQYLFARISLAEETMGRLQIKVSDEEGNIALEKTF